MTLIGLTGGVGAGKSEAAKCFAEAGVPVIDLDAIGREILEKDSTAVAMVAQLLGPTVVVQGKLDRRKIRDIVFKEEHRRKALENYLHPIIWQRCQKEVDRYKNQGKKIVLCEAALLIESKLYEEMDGLVVVFASETTRLKRLTERDRIPEELAQKMMAAQTTDSERNRWATQRIMNESTLGDLKKSVTLVVKQWEEKEWI